MGVKGLWQHLTPSARKINIYDLEGKVLAIDASIWAIQFLAVAYGTDEASELLNSNNEYRVVDGFLRRIMKLLFFGIRPVFVFDGQTPALKKKTLDERKKARSHLYGQQQEIDYKKAAEKLLNAVVQDQLQGDSGTRKSKTKSGNEEFEEDGLMVPAGFDADILEDINALPEEYCSDDCE